MTLRALVVGRNAAHDAGVSHALASMHAHAIVRVVDDVHAAVQALRTERHDLVLVVQADDDDRRVAETLRASSGACPVIVVRQGGCSLHDVLESQRVAAEAHRDLQAQADATAAMLGLLSHDMRNLLHAISLSAAYLERRPDMPDGTRHAIRRIKSSGKWALRLIRDVLVMSQARLGHGVPLMPVPTDLCELAQQIVDDFAEARPDHPVVLACEAPAPGLWDADRMAQLLSNLLSHAMDHAAAASPATLRITPQPRSMRFEVHCPGGAHPGPAAARADGLSLDVAELIVRAHGGTLEAQHGETGTRFVVSLPHRAPDTLFGARELDSRTTSPAR